MQTNIREFRVRPSALYDVMQQAGLLHNNELTERGVVVLLAAILQESGKDIIISAKTLDTVLTNGAFVQMSMNVTGDAPTGDTRLSVMPYQNRRPMGVPDSHDRPDLPVQEQDGQLVVILPGNAIGAVVAVAADTPHVEEAAANVGKLLQFKPRRGKME